MHPTDQTTHNILLAYHGTPEADLPTPQVTLAEVNEELRADEWNDLVTDNGNCTPFGRGGRNRSAPAASGASVEHDNR